MDKYIKFGIPILLSLGSFFYTFSEKIWKLIFPFKLNEKEKQMLLKYLEQKYPELENDLTNLLNLIKNEDIKKLAEKIRELKSKKTKVEKVLSEKKKIFILGDTGVGKSTLINCIEGKELAIEAKTSAPTTKEYKEFESNKYKNYIFCDTRGTEKNKYDKIVNDNLKSILNKSKGLNSYLFWYLIGASSNLQISDVNYIKKLLNLLNGKMPFFFIIARSVDEDNEKNRLESSLKEYFPYIINFNIFPVLARGTKRTPSFGLIELMKETEKFFKKDIILQEIFKEIYKEDEFQEHLLNSLNNNSDIKTLFTLILNKMRLNDYSKELNDNENQQMDNFKNIYQTFVESHFNNIRELCCLIKAKNKIIDIDKLENTTERLIDLNNSDKCFEDNIDIKKEILKGFNEEEKGKIESKAKEYSSDAKTNSEAKNFLNYFSVIKFNLKLENHIKNNLLLIKGLLD